MTVTRAAADSPVLTIYWMPGCSSCLRMKEFVERMEIPHVAVNAVESPQEVDVISRLGLTVPAAVLGGRGVPGVDLVGIADLAGIEYTPPDLLAPAQLHTRYLRVLDVAQSLIGLLDDAHLDYAEPDRPRTMRGLALHIVTIMRGFVDIEETNVFGKGMEGIAPELRVTATAQELLAVSRTTREQFTQWWDLVGSSDTFDRVVGSHNGFWTLHEALERAVWHTAQHTRQLQFFVQHRFGIELADELTIADLAGLGVPQGIHAGADG
jgi:glutaredoxin